jgi:uncharacterized protein with HEPN domain
VTRPDQERSDIVSAIERCQSYAPHLRSGEFAAMAYDAVLRNLAVIAGAAHSPSWQRCW